MRELDLQTTIIKCIKEEGGYGRKLSHRFLVGIPDLLLSLSLSEHPDDFELVLAEVKLLKVSNDYCLRANMPKLGVTPKQKIEMQRFKRACTIVGIQRGKTLNHIVVLDKNLDNFPDDEYLRFGAIRKDGTCRPSLTSLILETLDDQSP